MSANAPLPPDEPLDKRVTTGLAKIGIALKQQAWAEAGGRGLTPTQGQVLALLRANETAYAWALWQNSSASLPPPPPTASPRWNARAWSPRNRPRETAAAWPLCSLRMAAARRQQPLHGPTSYWRRSTSFPPPSRPRSCAPWSR